MLALGHTWAHLHITVIDEHALITSKERERETYNTHNEENKACLHRFVKCGHWIRGICGKAIIGDEGGDPKVG